MAVKARLEKLPQGLNFPVELTERIRFDPSHKQLVFHGFMTKAGYDRLRELSTDAAYLRAVELLFQRSAYEVPGASLWNARVVGGLVIVLAAGVIALWFWFGGV